jgi:hypothetical protein
VRDHFAQEPPDHGGATARHAGAEQAQAALDSRAGRRHVAALEGELTELAVDAGGCQGLPAERACATELGGRLHVPSPQHEHVAETFSDLAACSVVGRGGAALGNPILALRRLERVPAPGSVGRRQRIGEGALGLAGRVEVIRQIERLLRVHGLQARRRAAVEGAAFLGRQPPQHGLAQLVVHEHAPLAPRIGPDELSSAGFGERGQRHVGRLIAERGGDVEIELLAEHRARRQERQRRRR